MKKAYVVLFNCIVGMGGGQMYTYNKIEYMKHNGWDTFVFSSIQGVIIIEELKRYKHLIFPIMASSPLVYSEKKVSKKIEEITEVLKDFDNIVIESCSGHLALWGELIAQRLSCKHMVNLLDERNDLIVPEEYLDFYRFKLKRRELSGITNQSLKMLFRNNGEITDDNCYFLPARCQNVVSDRVHYNFKSLIKNAKTLCTIGRLEKDFVMAAAAAYAKITNSRKNEKFNVIFIGGTNDRKIYKKIRYLFKSNENVNLQITGYMYPIPLDLVKYCDLFVSSAGSAGISYQYNRPTISIDAKDSFAIGVLGYTTQASLYRVNEKKQDVAELIEKILYYDYLNNYDYLPKKEVTSNDMLKVHLEFLDSSDKNKEYFPIDKLSVSGKDKKKKIIRCILGNKGYIHLRPLFSKLFNR